MVSGRASPELGRHPPDVSLGPRNTIHDDRHGLKLHKEPRIQHRPSWCASTVAIASCRHPLTRKNFSEQNTKCTTGRLLNFRSTTLKRRLFASCHADQACRAPREARFDREGAHLWTRWRLGGTTGLVVGQRRSGLTSRGPEYMSS